MTIREAREAVEAIRALAGEPNCDDEAAHGAEDELYEKILRQLVDAKTAQELDDISLVAAIALETKDMDFERWCA